VRHWTFRGESRLSIKLSILGARREPRDHRDGSLAPAGRVFGNARLAGSSLLAWRQTGWLAGPYRLHDDRRKNGMATVSRIRQ
jgi:hypothetical protein